MKGSDSILNDAVAAVELVVDELVAHSYKRQARDDYLTSFAFINSQAVKKLFDR